MGTRRMKKSFLSRRSRICSDLESKKIKVALKAKNKISVCRGMGVGSGCGGGEVCAIL